MINKNILLLINKYNEDGTFVQIQNKIYWFNGQRLELWYEFGCGKFRLLWYKNQLYCRSEIGLLYIFKHLHFIPISNQNSKILDLFQNGISLTFFENHNVVYHENDTWLGICYIKNILATNEHLYLFQTSIYYKVYLKTWGITETFFNFDFLCIFKNIVYCFNGTSFSVIDIFFPCKQVSFVFVDNNYCNYALLFHSKYNMDAQLDNKMRKFYV